MANIRNFLGATTLAAVSAGAFGVADAQVTTQIYGGGAALIAPYVRQLEDCYGNPTPLILAGTNLTSPSTQTLPPFNFLGSPPLNCATTHVDSSVQFNYISVNSSAGIATIFSHDPATYYGDTVPGTSPSPYPSVQYAASENPLLASDVAIYTGGGTEGSKTTAVTVVAPGGVPGPGQYPNPAQKFGSLVQFPLLIAPVAIAYSPVYEKVTNADLSVTSYSFYIKKPRPDGSGGLVLDENTLCKIANGKITNWNDPALFALNGNTSLKDPGDPAVDPNVKTGGNWSVPLQTVGRFDSAGATAIFTRHLAAACANVTGNQFADGARTLPVTLQGPAYNKALDNNSVTDVPGKFTLATGADGVAKYIAFYLQPAPTPGATLIQGRIGYDGTDQVLPAIYLTGANTYGLNSASIRRLDTTVTPPVYRNISPNAASVASAYANLAPPQSDAAGNYSPATGTALRSNPGDWVQSLSKTSVLAIPANPNTYPLIGTANFIGYTCYADPTVTTKLLAFLKWYETNGIATLANINGLIGAAGQAPMPKAWRTAILQTFIKPTAAVGGSYPPTNVLNLNILHAGGGPASGTGSQCHAITPGG